MKTIKIIFAISIFVILYSCSKDDSAPKSASAQIVYEEENFLQSFLATSGLNQNTRNVSDPSLLVIEYLEFSATEKGKIKAFTFKIPPVSGSNSVAVSLVDPVSGVVLQQVGLGDGAYVPGAMKTVELSPPFDLVKDKRYKLGLLSRSSYEHKRNLGADVSYPIQAGNIKIWGFSETDIATLDRTNMPAFYYGDFSFNFQRTE